MDICFSFYYVADTQGFIFLPREGRAGLVGTINIYNITAVAKYICVFR